MCGAGLFAQRLFMDNEYCFPVFTDRTAGGWGEIRTHGEIAPTPVFKTGALNRSATHPAWFFLDQPGYVWKHVNKLRLGYKLEKGRRRSCLSASLASAIGPWQKHVIHKS